MDCFLSGLKPKIRRDVLAQSPFSISKAVSLARLFEEKYPNRPKPYHSTNPNRPTPTPQYTTTRNPTLSPLLPTPNSTPSTQHQKPHPIKYISPIEVQLCREKGLCYFRDAKFSPSHHCQNKQYLLLLAEGETPIDPEPKPPDTTETPTSPTQTDKPNHHLSFNALKRSNSIALSGSKDPSKGLSYKSSSIAKARIISCNHGWPNFANCRSNLHQTFRFSWGMEIAL